MPAHYYFTLSDNMRHVRSIEVFVAVGQATPLTSRGLWLGADGRVAFYSSILFFWIGAVGDESLYVHINTTQRGVFHPIQSGVFDHKKTDFYFGFQ